MSEAPEVCEWCYDAPASSRVPPPGFYSSSYRTCGECRPKAIRFMDALDGRPDASWLPKPGEPFLTIDRGDGATPTRIMNPNLPATKLRALLPKPPRKTRKPKAAMTPDDVVADLAKRRDKVRRERVSIERDTRALVESGDMSAAEIARRLGVSRQRVYQIAQS